MPENLEFVGNWESESETVERVGVLVTNPNAKALYLRLGFEETVTLHRFDGQ